MNKRLHVVPSPTTNEDEAAELVKLYSAENSELRQKLMEAEKTRQRNAAALAVQTRLANQLEKENAELRRHLHEVAHKRTVPTDAPVSAKEAVLEDGVRKLVVALQDMIDADMMTADEAFNRLVRKYRR